MKFIWSNIQRWKYKDTSETLPIIFISNLINYIQFPTSMLSSEKFNICLNDIDAFELWCWRRLLRVLWTVRRSNQSILKEINSEYSLEGLMLKLKLSLTTWYEELTHWKRSWRWERLRVREVGDRGWEVWMASPTQWTWVWANSWRQWRTGQLVCCSPRGLKELGTTQWLDSST